MLLMEIEAKFSVPDKEIFNRLISAATIGHFELDAAVKTLLEDTYLDTVDMLIMSEGYYLRRREKEKNIIYTLKSLGGSGEGDIRHREEMEYSLAHDEPIEGWEDSHMKSFLSQLVGNSSLVPLFHVSHLRSDRKISGTEEHFAELSLDNVKIEALGKEIEYQEIEAELLPSADQTELETLVNILKTEFSLEPGNRSKFEYGIELLNGSEKEILSNEDAVIPCTPLPLKKLFKKYHVEREHARKVTENALKLFDDLKEVHRLADEYRRVIWIASLVHDIGMYNDVENHHKAGRDILMHSPPIELQRKFWPVAVWTTFLHKKKINQEKLEKLQLKTFGKLSAQMQQDIIKLAALIRIADGLDYSRMDSSLDKIIVDEYNVMILVKGQSSTIDADRADTKSDLWRLIFDHMISFKAED